MKNIQRDSVHLEHRLHQEKPPGKKMIGESEYNIMYFLFQLFSCVIGECTAPILNIILSLCKKKISNEKKFDSKVLYLC